MARQKKNYKHRITKELLAEHGYSLTDFANAININCGSLSSLIRNGKANFSKISTVADALNLDPYELLANPEDILVMDESLKSIAKSEVRIECPCCGMPLSIQLDCGVPSGVELNIQHNYETQKEHIKQLQKRVAELKKRLK